MAWLVRPNGCRLNHEVHGDPSRPPLLLLEGMASDAVVLEFIRRHSP